MSTRCRRTASAGSAIPPAPMLSVSLLRFEEFDILGILNPLVGDLIARCVRVPGLYIPYSPIHIVDLLFWFSLLRVDVG